MHTRMVPAARALVEMADELSSGTGSESDACGANEVCVNHMAFNPATLTVCGGETVTWKFDENGHSTTSDAPEAPEAQDTWDSGVVKKGQTYTHTFSNAGTFGYHCSVMPEMKGTIVVRNP